MPTKRTPLNRRRKGVLRSPEMRAKAARLLELNEAHLLAIRDARPENQLFYEDGRFEEMHAIGPEVRMALGIMPWMDQEEMLREALEGAR